MPDDEHRDLIPSNSEDSGKASRDSHGQAAHAGGAQDADASMLASDADDCSLRSEPSSASSSSHSPPDDGTGEPLSIPPDSLCSDSPALRESRLSFYDREGLAPGFFAVLFIGCGLSLLYVLQDFVTDLVVAFILVGLFGGWHRRLTRGLGGRRWLASSIVTFFVLIALLVPLTGLGYTIAQDAAKAYDATVEAVAAARTPAGLDVQLGGWLNRFGFEFSPEYVKSIILEVVQGVRGVAMDWGSALLSNTLAAVVNFAIVIVLVFYLLVDGERLRTFVFELSPLPDDEDALIVDTFKKVAMGVVVGNGVGSGLQGLFGGLAMACVGLSSPVLWGSVMALFAFLPLVGISVVVLPATVYLLIEDRYWSALAFFSFCTLQGLVVENVIKTKLIGSHMRMHDLLVFLSILGGVTTFGVVGLVYGPLIAMLFMTLSDLYSQRYRPRLARRYARAHDAVEF